MKSMIIIIIINIIIIICMPSPITWIGVELSGLCEADEGDLDLDLGQIRV